ncbi:WxL domain-containing protein [Lapidilactobacillus luobeiensis]|uniref:WxL domain-containing protein n=1 Tax=Lapidilactobacillus luobeiensis TaxID=2950371 RepID=UPI0021C3CAFB|nr:WxL domain-containing protein [Lapidilactobacillus luobeiensis]
MITGLLPLGVTSRIVRAATNNDVADYANALKTAPQGIMLSDANGDLFKTGTGKPAGTTNIAKIVDTQNANLIKQTQAVLVTNGLNQVGSIWSNPDNPTAYWDFSAPQKASMWLFFGSNPDPADGMAIVFHNDPRGIGAIGAKGQSLGVYGSGVDQTTSASNVIKAGAVQNSWAFEFDTNLNNVQTTAGLLGAPVSTGGENSFDINANVPGPHIATTYPYRESSFIRADSYPLWVGWNRDEAWNFYMKHEDLVSIPKNQIVDGTWHHFSLEWNPTTQKFTYSFNDKDPVTGLPTPSKAISATTSKFDWTMADQPIGSKMLWGFTGSTGAKSETAMVIFESLPSLVNATAGLKITDDSQNNKVISTGSTVLPGDELTYTYKLDYDHGNTTWQNIVTGITLNKNIQFTSGKITYADNSVESIPASELTYNGTTDTALKHSLSKNLGPTMLGATIELKGVVKGVNTTIVAQDDKFVGTNFMTNSTAPRYTILEDKQIKIFGIPLSNTPKTFNVDFPVTVDLDPSYAVGYYYPNEENPVGEITNNVFTLSAVLHNNATGKDQAIPEDKIVWDEGPNGDSGEFKITIPKELFDSPGNYTLKITAKDDDGRIGTLATTQIFVHGILELKVNTASSFTDARLTGATMLVDRADDWSVVVSDMRGTGAGWKLSATATPLKPTESSLSANAGNLVFINGEQQTILPNTGTEPALTIATKAATTSPSADEGQDISTAWGADGGIKAQISSAAVGGTYSSTITWLLADTPN